MPTAPQQHPGPMPVGLLPDPRMAGRVPDLVPDVDAMRIIEASVGLHSHNQARGVVREATRQPPPLPTEQSQSVWGRVLGRAAGHSYCTLSRDPEPGQEEGQYKRMASRWLVLLVMVLVVLLTFVLLAQLCPHTSGDPEPGERRSAEQDGVHSVFRQHPEGAWDATSLTSLLPTHQEDDGLRKGAMVEAHFHRGGTGPRSTFVDAGTVLSKGDRAVAIQFRHAGTQVVPTEWVIAVLPDAAGAPQTTPPPSPPPPPPPTTTTAPPPSPPPPPRRTTTRAPPPRTTTTAAKAKPPWQLPRAPPANKPEATSARRAPPAPAPATRVRPPVAVAVAAAAVPGPSVIAKAKPAVSPLLKRVTLFCFSVMMSNGPELSLVRTQLAQGAGIFGCDEWSVFSDIKTWLTPGPPVRIDSEVVPSNLTAQWDGGATHWKNTGQFVQAWERVKQDAKYRSCDWVVKADPDAVFFPERLRKRVQGLDPHLGSGSYLLNCNGYGTVWMFGALEVMSQAAAEAYFQSNGRCQKELDWWNLGEDTFLSKCLDLLGAARVEAFDSLRDAYCNSQPTPCTSTEAIAFHPLKTPEGYFQCWGDAKRASQAAGIAYFQ